MPRLRLGKLPARPGAITFRLSNYLKLKALPEPPAVFGEYGAVKSWGMLGNDNWGDCVFAGAAHETMVWMKSGHHRVPKFSDAVVLADYSLVTGFKPSDPSTDNGTDMQEAASFRRKVGVQDAMGRRHKVEAYLAIENSLHQHLVATHLFGAVGVGFLFPNSAWQQFDEGRPWDVVPGTPQPNEGHYVPLLGRRANGNLVVVSWGKLVEMTPAFLAKYNDESVCYFSTEMMSRITPHLSPDGFDLAALRDDLRALG